MALSPKQLEEYKANGFLLLDLLDLPSVDVAVAVDDAGGDYLAVDDFLIRHPGRQPYQQHYYKTMLMNRDRAHTFNGTCEGLPAWSRASKGHNAC